MGAAVKRIGELTEKQPGETGLIDTNDISTSIDTIKIKIQGKYPDEIYVKGFERASDNIDDAGRPLFRVYVAHYPIYAKHQRFLT